MTTRATLPALPALTARPRDRLSALLLGSRPAGSVPEQVRAAIAAEQESGEVLVCCAQAAAIVLFGALYTLTPKAFPAGVPFEPVPWTLGAYALFTGLRLWLALGRRLRPWFLALSVVVDVAVLMLTIWSFHLQYQAPAAIYLKAPTLMYAFILIALRALRFETRWVLLAGVAAALGWIVLVAYALLAGDVPVTRDYATYMMSYGILLGAEVDKVVSLLVVTGILCLALARARRLLERAVTEQQAATGLARFFAPEVASSIRGADMELGSGQGTVRDAAVMMLDLRGFTPLSQRLSPGETIALLRDYQDRLVPVIQAHGGSIDKYMGDGILATFGATRESRTFAADALRALEAALGAGAAWERERAAAGLPPVRIGVAVATGPVLCGTVGHASRLEHTVIGEAVNLAAKLEKHTKAEGGRGIAAGDALALAQAQGYRPTRAGTPELRQACAVPGVEAPLDLALFA